MNDDAAGVDEAYSTSKGLYSAGSTLFIAGTTSLGDVADDLSIPLGLTSTTARHRDASMVLAASPQFSTLVGHSLGGAVALQLQTENPELNTRTYGAPVASTAPSSERFRHWGPRGDAGFRGRRRRSAGFKSAFLRGAGVGASQQIRNR